MPAHSLGLFSLDGDALDSNTAAVAPDDWNSLFPTDGSPNEAAKLFVADQSGSSTFTGGGSKDVRDVSEWLHAGGSVPDKDEIINAYTASYLKDTDNDGNKELILYFGADRFANSGDSAIGYWFFQNAVSPNANGTFNGTHAVGDILIVSDFSNGGGTSTIHVYKWVGGSNPLALQTTTGDDASAIVNSSPTTSPWTYAPKSGSPGTFPSGSFFEGGVNLTKVLNLPTNNCISFSSFMAETRSSTSTTAELKDFALGNVRVTNCGSITGQKFNDLDGDGTKDAGEPGLPGWTIQLDKGANGTVDGTDVTDASGNYSFTDLFPAVYRVREGQQAGWAQTTANPADISISSGVIRSGVDFGNFKANARILLSPLQATNAVTDPHEITATVEQNTGPGWVAVPNGTVVVFSLPHNSAGAAFLPDGVDSNNDGNSGNDCVTSNGKCIVTINSVSAGSVDIHGAVTVTVAGLPLTRETNTGGFNSPDANKIYVDAFMTIARSGVNHVGAPHTFTITVMENLGDGRGFLPAAGELVTGSLTNANGAASSFVDGHVCTTNLSGQCTLIVNSPTTGLATVNASSAVSVGGLTIDVETDGTGRNSGPGTKRWVDAQIDISGSAVNRVGEPHTFTVTVLEDRGDGQGFVFATGETVTASLANSNGATANFVGGSTCTTAANGTCLITVNSLTTGVVTITAASAVSVQGITVNVETDGIGLNSGPATKRYVDAQIDIAGSAVNRVGQPHTFTITVLEDQGDGLGFVPAAGEDVTGTLTNANGTTANFVGGNGCTTDLIGQCTLMVNSPTTGIATVNASSTVSVGGITVNAATDGIGFNSGPATKRWVDAQIDIVGSAVNRVGQPHTFTVTVLEDRGDGVGFVSASGETVTGSIVSSNGATASFVAGNTCTSNANGQCTLTVNSPTTGLATISAESSVAVEGIAITVQTDGTGLNSPPGTKRWVNAKIGIAGTGVNEVSDPHTFTVTVHEDAGDGAGFQLASGKSVLVTLINANGAVNAPSTPLSGTTNAQGQFQVSFNSASAGQVTGHAASDVSVGGITVHIETDATGANSGDVVKTYVDAFITLSPLQAVNPIGDPHTITASVRQDDGMASGIAGADSVSGFGPARNGTIVVFSLSNSNGATASFMDDGIDSNGDSITGNDCLTAGGFCSIQIVSSTPGMVLIHGTVTFAVNGVTLTRSTGSGIDNGPDVRKEYVAGGIVIRKETNPDGSVQSFEFVPSYAANFFLKDNQSNSSGSLAPGTYSVSENVPAGWDLTSASCSDGSPVNAIGLQAGEIVTCTFRNTQRGRIIITKEANPDSSAQAFRFTAGYASNGFALSDGQSHTSAWLVPGSYTVTESAVAGWDLTGLLCRDAGSTVSLATRTATIDVDPGETIRCTFTNTEQAEVAGFVYHDANNDGVRGSSESPIAGVLITLVDVAGAVSVTTITAADGSYRFANLRPGTYMIAETQPAGFLDGKDALGNLGGRKANDSFSNIVLTAGANGTNYNFGELKPASISGLVYEDKDNDGVRDIGEPGIAGVTVTLVGTNDLGQTVTRTTTTFASGYRFAGLRPGTYTVSEVQPAGFLDGKDTLGTVNGLVRGSKPANDKLSIPLRSGDNGVNYNFGELRPASISGFVYLDKDNDGLKETGEPGLAAVPVSLKGTNDLGQFVSRVLTTFASGYRFSGLRPGTYTIAEGALPPELVDKLFDGKDTLGTIDGVVRGTKPVNDQFAVSLQSGNNGINYNFGEQERAVSPTFRLSGFVYIDDDNDGIKDANEVGIGGATVTLTGTDEDGKAVRKSFATRSDGSYSFIGLLPGAYSITETQPVGFADGKDRVGTKGGVTTNDRFSSILLRAIDRVLEGVNYNFGELRLSPDKVCFIADEQC